MAVFICCADESTDGRQETDFFFGGFAARVDVWENDFSPRWDEKVLGGSPRLEYLRVAAIFRDEWRLERGMDWREADRRLTEASYVIGNTGGLIPIVCHISQDRFKKEVLPFAPRGKRHSGLEQPDYLAFLMFTYTTLLWLRSYRRDEVDKVDFWVEEQGRVTRRLGQMHERISGNLTDLGLSDLAALVGDFFPAPKKRIPPQAADYLCWHERNAKSNMLDRDGWRRRQRMMRDRDGCRIDADSTILDAFAETLRMKFPRVRDVG